MMSFCAKANDDNLSVERKPQSLTANAQKRAETDKFSNTHIDYKTSLSDMWKVAKAYWRDDRKAATPALTIPVIPVTAASLGKINEDSVIKLGHSTTLLKLDAQYILIDPVFSERASPVQWMGPKRFHSAPISINALPHLAAVIISHDHYDHLDKTSIDALKSKTDQFVVPLKVGNHLRHWGVSDNRITELDWWQSVTVNNIDITATPSQHFSGRGLFDRDKTLWASWVINGENANVFYSGDSGYFDGFKDIGEKFGPFDLSLVETGAYNELWSDIHMLPRQSLQAHIDVKARVLMPVHNSTFDLALHNWNEPLVEITQLATKHQIPISTPMFGEVVPILRAAEAPNKHWWLE